MSVSESLSSNEDTRRIIWSYGGGVQTIAILTLIAEGKLPKPELTIMSDTVRERQSTWDYVEEIAGPMMENLGMAFEVASHSLATVDLYGHNGDLLIPAYTETGKLPTFCSSEWKKSVVRRRLRQLGYGPDNPITCWMGMSLNEVHRMRDADVKWIQNHYPLILDIPLRKIDCIAQIKRFGLPVPSKSACWMCPHMNNEEWRDVRDNHPDDWQKAIQFDRMIREGDKHGNVYVHGDRVPLDQANLDEDRSLPLFDCADTCMT